MHKEKNSTCQEKPAALNSSSALGLESHSRGLICNFFSADEKEGIKSKRGILAEMKCYMFAGAALTLIDGVLSPAETLSDDN